MTEVTIATNNVALEDLEAMDPPAATSNTVSAKWKLTAVAAIASLLVLFVFVAMNSLGGKSNQQDVNGDLPAGEREIPFTTSPSIGPSPFPTQEPSVQPTILPSKAPSNFPTLYPTFMPSAFPSASPSASPSAAPSAFPSACPSASPSASPSSTPSQAPTALVQCGYTLPALDTQLGVTNEIAEDFNAWKSDYLEGPYDEFSHYRDIMEEATDKAVDTAMDLFNQLTGNNRALEEKAWAELPLGGKFMKVLKIGGWTNCFRP